MVRMKSAGWWPHSLLSTSTYDSCLAAAKEQFLPFPVQSEPPASLGPLDLSGCQSREPCDMERDPV